MKARLLESREISPDVRHFWFEAPETASLDFQPGQFLSFTGMFAGKNITRAYSIASPPEGNRFELCLNLVREGHFSPHLFGMAPGDEVEMKGPYGVFTFREPVGDTLLVATGTGVAPFRSMLLARLPQDDQHVFTLIFGVRHEHGILYREEFEELARQYPHFRFHPTLTRPGDQWQGKTGRVQQHTLKALGERRDVTVYICGMKEMVDETRALLKEAGLDRKRIVVEKYD
jgi:CDP-4-dehydro-6-deoxyglucose reductase